MEDGDATTAVEFLHNDTNFEFVPSNNNEGLPAISGWPAGPWIPGDFQSPFGSTEYDFQDQNAVPMPPLDCHELQFDLAGLYQPGLSPSPVCHTPIVEQDAGEYMPFLDSGES
jgi:hypothetical protein